MGTFRLVYRLIGLVLIQLILGFAGLTTALVLSAFGNARDRAIACLMQVWGQWCCWMTGVRIHRINTVEDSGQGRLIVSNHIGSVDIFVMAACFKACFVSKSDVRNWPVIGLLTRIANTIFIDRTRRSGLKKMVQAIAGRLRSGFSVVVFPEGGATPGDRVEPFKSSVFESVVQANRSVLPVTLRYYEDGEPSVACWPLGISFMANMKRLLMHPRLQVKVWVMPEVKGATDRHEFAEKSQVLISEQYQASKTQPRSEL